MSSDHFTELMSRVRIGSEEAVEEMLVLCRPQIVRIVRSRLGHELRSQYDSEELGIHFPQVTPRCSVWVWKTIRER